MSTILQTESFKLLEKPEKNKYGADIAPASASEELRQMFSPKRRDSESSTGIDRQNQRLRYNSERGALVRGSDPSEGHRVYTMAGDMWRALARSMIKINWSLVCKNQRTKILD